MQEKRMNRSVLCVLVCLACAPLTAAGEGATSGPTATALPEAVPGLRYQLERVSEGVYCAVASGVPYYVANSAVIVGSDSVLVVDSGAGPNEARVLAESIRQITDRPVRYLVDTHFHFDHALGHQAFPQAVVISHQATREQLVSDGLRERTVAGFISGLPQQIERANAAAQKETAPDKRAAITAAAAALTAYQKELATFVPSGADATFSNELTLWLGSREVRLLHLGRGHTAGDVVVFLPQERVVCTGDLFNGYIGYMGNAYVDEWAETLTRLAALDFETVIAGHGAPFRGKDGIVPVQAVLRDLWQQAAALKRAGLAADAAAERVDLRAHAARFPPLARLGYEPLAVRRIYEVIDERQARTPSR
jgi:cyclase